VIYTSIIYAIPVQWVKPIDRSGGFEPPPYIINRSIFENINIENLVKECRYENTEKNTR